MMGGRVRAVYLVQQRTCRENKHWLLDEHLAGEN